MTARSAAETSIQELSPDRCAAAIAADWSETCFSSAAIRFDSEPDCEVDAAGATTAAPGEGDCAQAISPAIGGLPAKTPTHKTSNPFANIKRICRSPVSTIKP